MSLAADARDAVKARPFLHEALRAGVVNYSAAARAIDVGDDEAAVATALRRYAEGLPDRAIEARRASVTMHSGLAPADEGDALLSVNGAGFAADGGEHTGVLATGAVDPAALGHALGRLGTADVTPVAAGVADGSLCVVVERRDGPAAVQAVESALEAVPDPTV
ncbi:MAG: hypothetical protein U5J98_11425 [Halobacteriales archaeon]|nr:hypothetical protein [Halobacteriales archaeon]